VRLLGSENERAAVAIGLAVIGFWVFVSLLRLHFARPPFHSRRMRGRDFTCAWRTDRFSGSPATRAL